MNAEIISVGTELLLGHTVNTDTTIVARALSDLGINLLHASTVGDNIERLKEALVLALSRSDLVITTGGLGPTEDDLTKETIAEIAGVPLELHAESFAKLEQVFEGRYFGENQKKQALLPKGAKVLPNDCGTAPGCIITTTTGARIVMFPGPPSELTVMLNTYVVPYLLELEHGAIFSNNIHVFGKGEGLVAEEIAAYINGENPTVATYAKDGEMFVRVTAKAGTKEQAEELCRPVTNQIVTLLGDVVYGVNTNTLEETVVALLKEQGKTLATAESCTGGLLAKRITDVSGASSVFEMGVVTYANAVKTQLIEVPKELLDEFGAVSQQVAEAMAIGVRNKAQSDFGIGITGIAGPEGGSLEKPVGLIYVGFTDGKQIWVKKLMTTKGTKKNREYYRNLASSYALNMVRLYLREINLL